MFASFTIIRKLWNLGYCKLSFITKCDISWVMLNISSKWHEMYSIIDSYIAIFVLGNTSFHYVSIFHHFWKSLFFIVKFNFIPNIEQNLLNESIWCCKLQTVSTFNENDQSLAQRNKGLDWSPPFLCN